MWRLFVQRIKVTEYSSHKPQTTLRKLYGRHTDLVHKFYILVSHMLEGFVHGMWYTTGFQLFWKWIVPGAISGQEMFTFSGPPDCIPLGSSRLHQFIIHIHDRMCQSYHHVYGLFIGLFAWIILNSSSGLILSICLCFTITKDDTYLIWARLLNCASTGVFRHNYTSYSQRMM